ncbi:MAG: hypothetical protein DRH26_01075 [Deltaproteobacteria bacterium]|nr:MAG: hypothetical protein DRH26_01075 [Deltaproteobacteria bacterium]
MSIRLQPVDLNLTGWVPTTAQAENAENGIKASDEILATPIESLTSGTIAGQGVFDVLMRVAKLHLKEEFDENRITGNDYANVYVGSMAAVLQTATQFLLNEQQVYKLNADIGLVRQQTVSELANTDDNIPIGLGFNHLPKDITPIPSVPSPGGDL